jgi:hypothetical protein
MIAIAEVRRALLIIDHHLRWVENGLDLALASEINKMVQHTSDHSESVYKRCRITLCKTCDAILLIHPEMDRMEVHRKHKIDSQRL